jgi:phosphoribosylglycinamide formyltransferase-1
MAETIEAAGAGLVVLAGYMRVLGDAFVQRFHGRMLNIHPSLLPRYRGLDTYRRVLQAGDGWHGASVHFVTEDLDSGPVIAQAPVPVLADDDEQSLSTRVKARERVMYPQVIDWFASGRLEMRAGAAWLDGGRLARPHVFEWTGEVPA